jgi:hypothetical protein
MNRTFATDPRERERRLGTFAGTAAIGVVVLALGAILVAASGSTVDRTPKSSPTRIEQLTDLHHGAREQEIGVYVRGLAMLLMIGVSLYLWDVVRRRDPSLPRWIFWAGIIGPPLVAISNAVGFYVLRDIADGFVTAGPHTLDRANHLIESSDSLRWVRIFEIASSTILGAWTASISFYGMRIGLLTRFLGIGGVFAGVITAILQVSGEPFFLGWVACIGLLSFGWWPGDGRPPAWDSGRAIPWPAFGQPVARPPHSPSDIDED